MNKPTHYLLDHGDYNIISPVELRIKKIIAAEIMTRKIECNRS